MAASQQGTAAVRGAGLFAAVAMNFFWGAAAASGPAEAQRGVLLLALDQRQGSSDAGLQRPTADCPRGCCGCACGFPVPASHGGYTVELEYDCVGVPTVLLGGRTQSLHKNGSMMCAHMLPVQPAGWQTTNGVSFPLREHTVKRSLMAGTVPRMTSVIPVLLRDGARGGGSGARYRTSDVAGGGEEGSDVAGGGEEGETSGSAPTRGEEGDYIGFCYNAVDFVQEYVRHVWGVTLRVVSLCILRGNLFSFKGDSGL